MSYYWDSFWAELATHGVPHPETGAQLHPADLPDLTQRELLQVYTEWLYRKGAMK